MKTFTFSKVIIILLAGFYAFSVQSQSILISDSKTDLKFSKLSADNLLLNNSIGNINTSTIQVENIDYGILEIPGYAKSDKIGYPSVPVKRKLIEIPQQAELRVKIISYDQKEYNLNDLGVNTLYPCQGPQSKCADEELFQINNNIYSKDAFITDEIVKVEIVGQMRSQRLALISISPFEYNPKTNIIRVFENIVFEIEIINADMATTMNLKRNHYSPFFSGMQSGVMNNIQIDNRENFTSYPVKYVIVSDPFYSTTLQPLVEWKKRKGFNVVEAYTDEIGSSKEQIKSYLQSLYDDGTAEDPSPSFILFVGDLAQMPTWDNGNGVTDRNYVEYTGDLLPEIFYGRMSADTKDQLTSIINKTLQYEMYTMPDPSYLNEVVLVAGVDGSFAQDWGNGQINYGTENYFNEDHGILGQIYLYPESGSQSVQIQQDVSDGATFMNYSAHCGPSGWSDPSFTISDIPNLDNADKYGLMIGNCCSSSEYQTTCFAEEIVRAVDKGTVGYIGGSNSTYWDEDYYFGVGVGTISEDPPSYEETSLGNYDRSFHDHGEVFGDWYTTMDQVIFAGNLAVLEGSPGSAEYYWDIYNLIGDPSLMIYYGVPDIMPVSHDDVITIGQTTFSVVTEPYAYVALNMNDINYATVLADADGNAIINFDGFTNPGFAELVITAQNKQPWIEDILVFAPNGPFCMYESHLLQDDSLGNGNLKAEFNEEVFLNLSLKNYGTETAVDVEVNIATDNEYIVIIDEIESYGDIAADESVNKDHGFLIKLSDNVPDQMTLDFDILITDVNDSSWTSNLQLISYAPNLEASDLTVDDSEGGNGNGLLDPGETAIMTYKTYNNGHCLINNVTASLMAFNQYVTVESDDTTFPVVNTLMPCYASFNVSVAEDAPEGIFAEMHFELNGAGYEVSKTYFPKICELIEDWETGDFSKYDWQSGGDFPWEIIMEYPYEGYYHAASADMGDQKTSEFEIQYEVMAYDSISFNKKVSTEIDYDFLKFYIDNNLKAEWSGSEPWTKESFAVNPGNHTFKWVYEKDYSQTGGVDKVWIDYITLPTMMATTLFAGPDDNNCNLNIYSCQGSATNYDSLWWSSNGSGSFDYINILNSKYQPSQEDYDAGSIVLSLNIIDVDNISHSDNMTLSFSTIPEKAYQPDGPETIDLETTSISDYATESIPNADWYYWEIFPAYAGTIIGEEEGVQIAWNTDYEGEVWIKVAGNNDCGIGEFSDSLMVILSNPVGLISANSKVNLDIRPNPNNGIFNLVIESTAKEALEMSIVNSYGQIINKRNIFVDGTYNESIDLQNTNAGIYLIILRNENTTNIRKILIN